MNKKNIRDLHAEWNARKVAKINCDRSSMVVHSDVDDNNLVTSK